MLWRFGLWCIKSTGFLFPGISSSAFISSFPILYSTLSSPIPRVGHFDFHEPIFSRPRAGLKCFITSSYQHFLNITNPVASTIDMYSTIAATSLFLASAFTSPLAAPAPAPVPWDPNPIGIPQGVVNASFTVYDGCGASVSCGPSWAAEPGKGYAAINILQYSTPTNGAPDACGSCWHIQPQTDVYPSQGLSVGKPIVVKVGLPLSPINSILHLTYSSD